MEDTIPAVESKMLFKDWGKIHHQAVIRMNRTQKPCCLRCMKIDSDNGELNDLDYYFNLKYKLLQKVELFDHKDSARKIGENWEFRCPKGHGITLKIEVKRLGKKK